MRWRRHPHAVAFLPGIGRADHCEISTTHSPPPLRYIWHHLQPQVCGGATVPANLASLCDNCHYAVHALLLELKVHGTITAYPGDNAQRIALAEKGYALCQAAGTVSKIPDEGVG